jgi:CheY-like chemotaxis protein
MKPDFNGKTILIVEDDRVSALLLKEYLGPTKANTIVVYSGYLASDIIREQSIDLVLLDIKLGDCNGFDVMHQIRKINPEVFIIAQTANAMVEDYQKCIDAGFDDYISKPINAGILYTKIRQLFSKGI